MSAGERVCADLNAAIDALRGEGYRLDSIYPADDPHTAVLSKGDGRVRVTTRPGEVPPATLAPFAPEFVLTRVGAAPGEGRAGMYYRDLIPSRLGGRTIASHITIPDGGPVADWVHYHEVALQMIVVRRGWVRVVYEDQGDPFVMQAGDMVLQPPLIRHRVLESSPGLEVVEISCPALHETFADHDLALPNLVPSGRTYGGQRFLHHRLDARGDAVREATDEVADVRILSPGTVPARFSPHAGELVFGFVLEGRARLDYRAGFDLGPADAFVIPPDEAWALSAMSDDFRLLHATTAHIG